ncbi:hypothetical protein niasHS_010823 [Heterodera schachtii]|uniref:Nudix hydrolase domain-containing protein n=1 Tax=Heterodera schachtii TaxID=97005 RepID=A0ABD2IZT8_HETSC
MLRRGSSAKFMPNSSVFPGGVLDKLDLCFPREKTNFVEGTQSPIRLELADDFALRVCALRELFEEAGLLPVVEGEKRVVANAGEDVHLAEWRRKVMAEPALFSQLFHNRFQMDVSSLIPWSNWLTPFEPRPTPRFNTAFFLFLLATPKPQKVRHCVKEMAEAEWTEPSQIIGKNAKGEVSLPPPQFYELSRIQRIECFKNEGKIREMVDPKRKTPHSFRVDGSALRVHALPGDYLYDETNPDFKPPVYGDEKELSPPYPKDGTKPMHRMIFYAEEDKLRYHKLKLCVNIPNKVFVTF